MRKRTVRFDDWLIFTNTIVGGNDNCDLLGQADGFANVGLVIVVLFVRIIKSEG